MELKKELHVLAVLQGRDGASVPFFTWQNIYNNYCVEYGYNAESIDSSDDYDIRLTIDMNYKQLGDNNIYILNNHYEHLPCIAGIVGYDLALPDSFIKELRDNFIIKNGVWAYKVQAMPFNTDEYTKILMGSFVSFDTIESIVSDRVLLNLIKR